MLYKKIYNLGDKLEDKARGRLSHYPLVYAFVGGTGIILFWRGVWHTADLAVRLLAAADGGASSTNLSLLPWWDGPLSMSVGAALLLTVGLFVSSFIGSEIIISGLKKEKKIIEKTEDEVAIEMMEDENMKQEIHGMDSRLKRVEKIIKKI